MPHIVIEYSENLAKEIKEHNITHQLREVVIASGLFEASEVKARSIAYSDFVLDAGLNSFIHVTTEILAGRPMEKRHELSQDIHDKILALIPHADKVSSNVHEMERTTYVK